MSGAAACGTLGVVHRLLVWGITTCLALLALADPARAEELPVAGDADPSIITPFGAVGSRPVLTVVLTRVRSRPWMIVASEVR